MPVSVARAEAHVKHWVAALERFSTSQWPPYLFHTAQIEVAVAIIKSKRIVCRKDQLDLICDVANQGALGNNLEAHKYARLYFRPKNPFHLKTEGIKTVEDHNRGDPHMSIPIAFLFDLVGVLSQENAFFTQGNFAKSGVPALDGDANFDALDFSQIYHDSDPGGKGAEIRNMRMSEVVIPDSISLTHLKGVLCRTIHEARMLTYLLKQHGLTYPQIRVEQRGSVFFKRAIFIVDLYLEGEILSIRFHSPLSCSKTTYCVTVEVDDSVIGHKTGTWELGAGRLWKLPPLAVNSSAIWTITIEKCIAYKGPVPSGAGLIV